MPYKVYNSVLTLHVLERFVERVSPVPFKKAKNIIKNTLECPLAEYDYISKFGVRKVLKGKYKNTPFWLVMTPNKDTIITLVENYRPDAAARLIKEEL